MSSYHRIAAEFVKVGYTDSSYLTETELNSALDRIILNNVGIPEYDRSVCQEMFEQSPKNSQGQVQLSNFIGIIVKAHGILAKNISSLRQEIQSETGRDNRNETLGELFQFYEDLKILTIPFNLPGPEKIPLLEGYTDMTDKDHNRSFIIENTSTIRQQSKTMGAVLVILLVWVVLEFPCALVRYNFMDILTALVVLLIFVLKIFDKHYVRLCIVSLVVTFLLDLVWVLVMKNIYMHPQPVGPTFRSRHPFLYTYAFITTIVSMVFKLLIVIFLYPFRHNKPQVITVVRLPNVKIELEAVLSSNPLRSMFSTPVAVSGIQ